MITNLIGSATFQDLLSTLQPNASHFYHWRTGWLSWADHTPWRHKDGGLWGSENLSLTVTLSSLLPTENVPSSLVVLFFLDVGFHQPPSKQSNQKESLGHRWCEVDVIAQTFSPPTHHCTSSCSWFSWLCNHHHDGDCYTQYFWIWLCVKKVGFLHDVKPSSSTSSWLWIDLKGIQCVGRQEPTSRDLLCNDIREVLWMFSSNTPRSSWKRLHDFWDCSSIKCLTLCTKYHTE